MLSTFTVPSKVTKTLVCYGNKCPITEILINEMGFWNTVHKQNVSSGTLDGKDMLACCQVDDFAVGAEAPNTTKLFVMKISEHVQAKCAAMGIETKGGLHQ